MRTVQGRELQSRWEAVDDFGNEEIGVIFNEDFWMNERSRRVNVWETFKRVNRIADGMAYMEEDLEKVVGFV